VRCFRPLSHLSAILRAWSVARSGHARWKRARPLTHEFGFAKPKLDLECETTDMNKMSKYPTAPKIAEAKFSIGDVVRHRVFEFRGVVFDIDPVFANSDDWYESIPVEVRPTKDQPFYHLFAENSDNSYIAYVSQQNLLPDNQSGPVDHPAVEGFFAKWSGAKYELKRGMRH
jgi:heat shock protein HspQ